MFVITGNEVFYGRIKDTFGPVIREKLEEYDVAVLGQKILSDAPETITQAVKDYIKEGAELVICTGGMSVDPDDTTPTAIKNAGGKKLLPMELRCFRCDVFSGLLQ